MIVDRLQTQERDQAFEHSARVRWRDGKFRLRFSVPAQMSAPAGQGSPYLAACLLQAMRRGEELHIDAPVSPRLLAAAEEVQTIYRCWAPSLRPTAVTVAGDAPAAQPASGVGCFFSRGVDSMFCAAAERPERLTHLIFIVDLDPINDHQTRIEEVRLAEKAAALLGKRLVLAETNMRLMADPLLDWGDLFGAGLSAVAHLLERGLGRAVIPSSCDWATMGPCGSSPVLDHLFSTEGMEIEHGAMGEGRHGKVRWLSRHRPELLPLLKVCYRENRPDNCGRCRKCLWTMVCLDAAGALERAHGFPPTIDIELIREMRLSDLPLRLFWLHAADALQASGRSPKVEQAVRHALHRSAHPSARDRARIRYAALRGRRPANDPAVCHSPLLFYRNQTNSALAVLRNGRTPNGSAESDRLEARRGVVRVNERIRAATAALLGRAAQVRRSR